MRSYLCCAFLLILAPASPGLAQQTAAPAGPETTQKEEQTAQPAAGSAGNEAQKQGAVV